MNTSKDKPVIEIMHGEKVRVLGTKGGFLVVEEVWPTPQWSAAWEPIGLAPDGSLRLRRSKKKTT